MKNEPKIAIVGVGARAYSHINALYELRDRHNLLNPGGESHPVDAYTQYSANPPAWAQDISGMRPQITALFDPSQQALEKAEQTCKAKGDAPACFDNLKEFFGSDSFDCLVIVSPNDQHTQPLLMALEKGMPILCEKPIATTLEEHDQLIDAANKSSSMLYVGFNLRSAPLYVFIKRMLDEGRIGRVSMVSCNEVRAPFRTGYRYESAQSGGALLEKNCHDLDLFNWFLDDNPVRVSSFGGQHVLNSNSEITDGQVVIIEYAGGQVATLELCLYAPFGQRSRTYELRGANGIMRTPEEPETIDIFSSGRKTREQFGNGDMGGHSGGDIIQAKRFLECIAGKANPPASLIDAKKSAAIAFAADKAMQEHQVISIDEKFDIR